MGKIKEREINELRNAIRDAVFYEKNKNSLLYIFFDNENQRYEVLTLNTEVTGVYNISNFHEGDKINEEEIEKTAREFIDEHES